MNFISALSWYGTQYSTYIDKLKLRDNLNLVGHVN